MRWIDKLPEPMKLSQWKIRYSKDANFGYNLLRKDKAIEDVEKSLLKEQGFICAYTGMRIDKTSFHVEHIKAQTHCNAGEDVDYKNMVACYPGSNTGEAPFGAHQKKNWPDDNERNLFISPLDKNCASKFTFTENGKIRATDKNDIAAVKTIKKLKLDHDILNDYRKASIDGILNKKEKTDIKQVKQALNRLKSQDVCTGKLEPFCFVLIPVLEKFIKKIEYIKSNKRS